MAASPRPSAEPVNRRVSHRCARMLRRSVGERRRKRQNDTGKRRARRTIHTVNEGSVTIILRLKRETIRKCLNQCIYLRVHLDVTQSNLKI